jgi:hypothetical protein
MLEREKQRSDQQKKHVKEKERRKHPHKDQKAQSRAGQEHAGMATDPEAMQDDDYVKRMNEKTEKH